MSLDEDWMKRALDLARKGKGSVNPNPMVGAVLVRAGRSIAEGYHRQYGEPHAEIDALRKAGPRAKSATLYVNLEPCSHWGKTPPCADALVRARVKRVVCAMQDPNPLVSGKGFRILRRAGISVTKGVLEQEARHLNRAFATWVTNKRPFVTLKVASSLDGQTATAMGESQWITGKKAREEVHTLRSHVDAIAVGLETVKADNPVLTAHGKGRNPVRVVFDSHLQSPLHARIFNREAATWCLATDHTVLRHLDQFKRKNVQVILCHADGKKHVSVPDALRHLAAKGITHLLVEGGRRLQQSFLEAGMVDDVVWYIAPLIIGSAKHLNRALILEKMRVVPVGADLRITACLPESFRRSAK